mmetsp:Transcript_85884/g.143318  ORF Transcript_85884/g.143318 Transcript_85884/m.143318 type:complete len:114 (+) Transcript_85884:171-512(+)
MQFDQTTGNTPGARMSAGTPMHATPNPMVHFLLMLWAYRTPAPNGAHDTPALPHSVSSSGGCLFSNITPTLGPCPPQPRVQAPRRGHRESLRLQSASVTRARKAGCVVVNGWH